MSQENVDVVRRAAAEFRETRRLSEEFAPDFVLETRTFGVSPDSRSSTAGAASSTSSSSGSIPMTSGSRSSRTLSMLGEIRSCLF
jgi:hypothetical protein